jgi:hypothetical protein
VRQALFEVDIGAPYSRAKAATADTFADFFMVSGSTAGAATARPSTASTKGSAMPFPIPRPNPTIGNLASWQFQGNHNMKFSK